MSTATLRTQACAKALEQFHATLAAAFTRRSRAQRLRLLRRADQWDRLAEQLGATPEERAAIRLATLKEERA